MTGVVGVDKEGRRGTVRAGSKIHALGRPLFDEGVAFKNQGDIDRQAIAGAVSTGTHGTGATLKSFSAEVAGLRLVSPAGEVIEAHACENAEVFEAGRLSLGALGILSELTFHLRDAYKLKEQNRVVGVTELFPQLPALRDKHRHVEFFWFPYTDVAVLKTLDQTDEPAPEPRTSVEMRSRGEVVTADQRAFRNGCRMVRVLPGMASHAQRIFTRGMAGSTRVRWSHEVFPSPRTVEFNEMEYAVPAERGLDCIREVVAEMRAKKISTAFPFEFRFVKGDDVWLSPFYQRDSVTIAVHQYFSHDHQKLFAMAEGIFRLHEGRPHWGKIHTRTADELKGLYPRFDDFRRVRR
jgi:FAD-linked oxidoreductase